MACFFATNGGQLGPEEEDTDDEDDSCGAADGAEGAMTSHEQVGEDDVSAVCRAILEDIVESVAQQDDADQKEDSRRKTTFCCWPFALLVLTASCLLSFMSSSPDGLLSNVSSFRDKVALPKAINLLPPSRRTIGVRECPKDSSSPLLGWASSFASSSSTTTQDDVNDDFCDCVDSSDETSTSACAGADTSVFTCKSSQRMMRSDDSHHMFQVIPSSRVDDGVCDCCDGSDELTPEEWRRRYPVKAKKAAAAAAAARVAKNHGNLNKNNKEDDEEEDAAVSSFEGGGDGGSGCPNTCAAEIKARVDALLVEASREEVGLLTASLELKPLGAKTFARIAGSMPVMEKAAAAAQEQFLKAQQTMAGDPNSRQNYQGMFMLQRLHGQAQHAMNSVAKARALLGMDLGEEEGLGGDDLGSSNDGGDGDGGDGGVNDLGVNDGNSKLGDVSNQQDHHPTTPRSTGPSSATTTPLPSSSSKGGNAWLGMVGKCAVSAVVNEKEVKGGTSNVDLEHFAFVVCPFDNVTQVRVHPPPATEDKVGSAVGGGGGRFDEHYDWLVRAYGGIGGEGGGGSTKDTTGDSSSSNEKKKEETLTAVLDSDVVERVGESTRRMTSVSVEVEGEASSMMVGAGLVLVVKGGESVVAGVEANNQTTSIDGTLPPTTILPKKKRKKRKKRPSISVVEWPPPPSSWTPVVLGRWSAWEVPPPPPPPSSSSLGSGVGGSYSGGGGSFLEEEHRRQQKIQGSPLDIALALRPLPHSPPRIFKPPPPNQQTLLDKAGGAGAASSASSAASSGSDARESSLSSRRGGGEGEVVMRFGRGDGCKAGVERSVALFFECGPSMEITSVQENGLCTYLITLATPAACSAYRAKALRREAASLITSSGLNSSPPH